MSEFARKFNADLLTEQVLADNRWLADMLSCWKPAGDGLKRGVTQAHEHLTYGQTADQNPHRLRLAIRNGYVNFYRAGQSIAKVSLTAGRTPQARVHNKYVYGLAGEGQSYVRLTAAGFHGKKEELRKYNGIADLHGMIDNASRHLGAEKKFVDLIVARNPNVVDVEMALPAFSAERVAPRMDLVALEPVGDRWRIVFWEAKLVVDGRARCRGDVEPKVVQQLKQYTNWLEHGEHRSLVAAQYQNACQVLVQLQSVAKKYNPDIEELGEGIVAAATPNAPPLLLDDVPRLLIDDRAKNVAFGQNGHLKKLRETCAIHVQMVHGYDSMAFEVRD